MRSNRELIKPVLHMGFGAYQEFQKALKDISAPAKNPFMTSVWTIKEIEALGFKLMQNDKLWCRFRGYGFDVLINLDTRYTKGNYFSFKCIGGNHKGNFKAEINTIQEFNTIIRCILK